MFPSTLDGPRHSIRVMRHEDWSPPTLPGTCHEHMHECTVGCSAHRQEHCAPVPGCCTHRTDWQCDAAPDCQTHAYRCLRCIRCYIRCCLRRRRCLGANGPALSLLRRVNNVICQFTRLLHRMRTGLTYCVRLPHVLTPAREDQKCLGLP